MCLYQLEQVKFKIISFGYVHKRRVVRRLPPGFYELQGNVCVPRCGLHHLNEQLVIHKMRAGTGGKIAAPGQQLHCAEVDLLIAAFCPLYRLAALGERGGIQYDEVIIRVLIAKRGKKVKYICRDEIHLVNKAVAPCVKLCHLYGGIGYVHGGYAISAAQCCIQGEGTGVCKAVQHLFACGYLGHGLTVVFLIKEKAGLLPVLHIYLVLYAVFGYPGDRGGRLGLIISQVPALAPIQTLELTDSYVVALEYAGEAIRALKQRYTDCVQLAVGDYIAARREPLAAGDVERRTYLLFGMMNWIFGWYSFDQHGSVDALAEEIFLTFTRGCLPRAQATHGEG